MNWKERARARLIDQMRREAANARTYAEVMSEGDEISDLRESIHSEEVAWAEELERAVTILTSAWEAERGPDDVRPLHPRDREGPASPTSDD
jgi:hypothetical protein